MVAEHPGDFRQAQPALYVVVDVFEYLVVDRAPAGLDLHALAQAHQYLVQLQADGGPLLPGLVEYGGAEVHHVHEGAALVDRPAHVEHVGGQLRGIAAAVFHPNQPHGVARIGGVKVTLVGREHEGLACVHVEHVAAAGDAALAVDDAVDQAVAVAVVAGDHEVLRRFEHDARPVDLHVQRVEVHRLGGDEVFVVGHAAHDVVFKVVRVIIPPHGRSLRIMSILKLYSIMIVLSTAGFVPTGRGMTPGAF